jgi:hypothetical protein
VEDDHPRCEGRITEEGAPLEHRLGEDLAPSAVRPTEADEGEEKEEPSPTVRE